MRLRLRVLLCVFLAVGCGASNAAPQPISANGQAVELVTIDGRAASAAGPGALAQLLTAPRPTAATTTTTNPAVPPPPPPEPYKTGPRGESPVITPPASLGPGDGTVYAVGDSVLLGTQGYLNQTVGGWDLRMDAVVGRRFPEGIDVLRQNRASIGQAAIILLGNNYGGGGQVYGYLDEIMAMMRSVDRVVFVTVREWSYAQPEVNRAIRALPKSYPNVVVADWSSVVDANPEFLVDNVHLNSAGDTALANLIAVMLGPANPNGKKVAPPKILPIPPVGPPKSSTPSSSSSSTSTSSTTSSTSPASSSTTSSSSTTTAPPVSSSVTTSSTPVLPP